MNQLFHEDYALIILSSEEKRESEKREEKEGARLQESSFRNELTVGDHLCPAMTCLGEDFV